jgi:hypothetical protein
LIYELDYASIALISLHMYMLQEQGLSNSTLTILFSDIPMFVLKSRKKKFKIEGK